MKKILLSVLIFSGIYTAGFAQTDAKAKAILTEVSKKYKSYKTVKAEFLSTVESQQSGEKDVQQGTVVFQPAENKYKVQMAERDMISDGKSQWTYLKKDKEIQISTLDANAFTPAKVFTIYESGFKSIYTGEQKQGSSVYQMIDLSPTDSKTSYFKIRLSIDKVSKYVANVIMFDKNGTKYTCKVKSFVPNVKVLPNTFTFDPKKYPGVEVVDLR